MTSFCYLQLSLTYANEKIKQAENQIIIKVTNCMFHYNNMYIIKYNLM